MSKTSTTEKYGFNFLIPLLLTDTPIPFTVFSKKDEEGIPTGEYYTYNEYMALPNKKAFYTPTNTHAILGINITSTKIRSQLVEMFAGTPFVVLDGDDIENWEDEEHTYYVWILSTDPRAVGYNYNAFTAVSPLFNLQDEAQDERLL